jgi:A/G-specific adenine glycosylase
LNSASPRLGGEQARSVSRPLLAWYRRGHRDLPWRRTTDPYRIWLSEIMLQQTRVQAAIPYYERFLARFPTVEALAVADERDVLALWSGLGYYSRARNLLRAAKAVAAAGAFPRNYEAIRALPGVGDYTAAAIASIAFGLPHAAVDGNVLRVAARLGNDASDIGSARTRARLRAAAEHWLDRRRPGEFNQALMELGATVCLPREPRCAACPVHALCAAHEAGTARALPVKLRRAEPVQVECELLVARHGRRVLLRRTAATARRLAGFWTLPSPEDAPALRAGEVLGEFRHSIVNHRFLVRVREAGAPAALPRDCAWFSARQLAEAPLATAARKALRIAGVMA